MEVEKRSDENNDPRVKGDDDEAKTSAASAVEGAGGNDGEGSHQRLPTLPQNAQEEANRNKRKHRRGKPKGKNANKKPYQNSNWPLHNRVRHPYHNQNNNNNNVNTHNNLNNKNNNQGKIGRRRHGDGSGGVGVGGGGGGRRTLRRGHGNRHNIIIVQRPTSLVPYNTNRFLMEEHLSEVPSDLLAPTGRTRDSSFSMDSEENYYHALPEAEEDFLTREFANVYERARVEQLESLSKQQLMEEYIQLEDRLSKETSEKIDHQMYSQRVIGEFTLKIRQLEQKLHEVTRENFDLREQLVRSSNILTGKMTAQTIQNSEDIDRTEKHLDMDSSSADSESDSTSSSSSSSSTSSSTSPISVHSGMQEVEDNLPTFYAQHQHQRFDYNSSNKSQNNSIDFQRSDLLDHESNCGSNTSSCNDRVHQPIRGKSLLPTLSSAVELQSSPPTSPRSSPTSLLKVCTKAASIN